MVYGEPLGGAGRGRKKAKGSKGAFPGRPAEGKAPKRVSRKASGYSLGQGPRRAGGKGKGQHVRSARGKSSPGASKSMVWAAVGMLGLPIAVILGVATYLVHGYGWL